MASPIKILAFDTTSGGLSVAVLEDQKILAQKEILENGLQAEMLIPTIESCLKEAGIWYSNLNLIAVTKGPGSFTGVRVGIATAKALSLASNLPLIGIGTLEAIAFDYKDSGYSKIVVALDGAMDEYFIQEFSCSNAELKSNYEVKLIPSGELEQHFPKDKFLLVGTNQKDRVKAENIAYIALEIYNSTNNFSADPIYIREPKISKRKQTG